MITLSANRPVGLPLPLMQFRGNAQGVTPEDIEHAFKNKSTVDMMRASRGLRDIPDFAERLQLALVGIERLTKLDARNSDWHQRQTYPVARQIMGDLLLNIQMPETPEALLLVSKQATELLEKVKRFDTGFNGKEGLHRYSEDLLNLMLKTTQGFLAHPVAQAVLQVDEARNTLQAERTRRDDTAAALEARRAAKRAPWAIEYYAKLAEEAAKRKS